MEKTVNIHHAKTHLSSLIAEAEAGEKITIARSGKPAVRLVPVKLPARAKKNAEMRLDRKAGFLRGKIKIRKGFYDPLPADMLKSMLGEDD